MHENVRYLEEGPRLISRSRLKMVSTKGIEFESAVIIRRLSGVGVEPAHALGENAMHVVEPFGQPFMLARPVGLVLRIDVIVVARNAAILLVGQFFPVQRIPKLAFNGLSLALQQLKEDLGSVAANVEFGADFVFGPDHHGVEMKAAAPDRKTHPGLWLRFLLPEMGPRRASNTLFKAAQ